MCADIVLHGLAVLLVCTLQTAIPSPAQTSVGDTALNSADRLYRSGQFAAAEAAYQAILRSNPKMVPAQVGFIRSLLREQKIDEAYEAAKQDVADQPNSAPLLVAMGDVQFRRGQMSSTEDSYLKALKADPKDVYAYLGLARLYRAYSLYRHAYDALTRAHAIAPDNPDVQRMYFAQLPRKQRTAALEAYLASPHPDDAEETREWQSYLEFLKATADSPLHSCKLISKVEKTDTHLERLFANPQTIRAFGLSVKLNDHSYHLLLDTGASGIVIGRKAAEKAGLTRISAERYGGIGDQGLQTGYTAVADRIRVGELEFHDCIVRVSDKASIIDEDGLIGADVFGAYLIDIDLPGEKLRLAPLPKRPEDASAPTALKTDTDSEPEGAEPSDREEQRAQSGESVSASKASNPTVVSGAPRPPRDRYIAPEMANWTKVFRFGHNLLIPTYVNDSPVMLFLIDTGSFSNIISTRAAREVTRIAQSRMQVRGLSGSVNQVFTADKANLVFSHFRQPNQDMVTIDLSGICKHTGTEVSGILGFNVLRQLEVKIDYRDGLVDFVRPNAGGRN